MTNATETKNPKRRTWLRRVLLALACVTLVCFALHAVVLASGSSRILDLEYSDEDIVAGLPDEKVDCILILGAGLWGDGPSPMLQERLETGLALYRAGAADKILVSGDNHIEDYNEVQVMQDYLVENGVPLEAICRDHAGFSTYESMYRAKEIFRVKSAIVVTQRYHLFRACYDAEGLGIEVYGADAQKTAYRGRYYREARECLARVKDFFMCIFKPNPTYLGDPVPIDEVQEPAVSHTYAGNMRSYYEMTDGTWQCEGYTYQYRLEITGRLNNAATDTTYVYLSNLEEITFEQAWKAGGLSSNSEDYFSPEEAVLVELD